MESRSVEIGGETYHIARYRGLKAALAGALVSRVMREMPELQKRVGDFRNEFKKNNAVRITPGMAKLPRFAMLGLQAEDFQASGGYIEIPEEPDQGTILVNVFPDLFELAQKELQRFLALIVISNKELEAADDADEVDEVLSRIGKKLLRQGDLDELLELAVVGGEVLQEQMASKKDRLGKLPFPWLQRMMAPPEETESNPESENNGLGETLPIPTETETPTTENSVPTLSSDSQLDSDGIAEQLSMESLGMN